MKRFLTFRGAKYYPEKGWKDFLGDFDSLDDAKTALLNINCDWWHIVDTELVFLGPMKDPTGTMPHLPFKIVAEGNRFGT